MIPLAGRPLSLTRIISAIAYAAIVPIVLAPLLWAVLGSFKPQSEFFRMPPSFLPLQWSVDAYEIIFGKTRILAILGNSIFVTGIATLGVLIVASLAAYGFSRWEFRFRTQSCCCYSYAS